MHQADANALGAAPTLLAPPVVHGPFVFLGIKPGLGGPALEVRYPGGEGVGTEIDYEGTQLTPDCWSVTDRAFIQLSFPKPAREPKPRGVKMQIPGLLPSGFRRPRGGLPPSSLTKITPGIWAINHVGEMHFPS